MWASVIADSGGPNKSGSSLLIGGNTYKISLITKKIWFEETKMHIQGVRNYLNNLNIDRIDSG